MTFLSLHNGERIRLADIPVLSFADFRAEVFAQINSGARISALFGQPLDDNDCGAGILPACGAGILPAKGMAQAGCLHHKTVRLVAVLAHAETGCLSVGFTNVSEAYPALTPDCPQAHWFEREIAEQWGVKPQGHPWLKPIRMNSGDMTRFPAVWKSGSCPPNSAPNSDFFRVEGEEIHEVAVGPVHAGVIEPGHFRFQCHGEHVYTLEISLGYQHRGVERALLNGPHRRTIHLMETLAGDTSIAHATAYCEAVESLAGTLAPARAQALRAVALELERCANHAGDLGALAGDVGYLPTASYCGRLRGEFLNLTALLCGSRFGRALVRPGGVLYDVDPGHVAELLQRLEKTFKDLKGAVNLLWDTPSVMARFEGTGIVSRQTCVDLGLVGPAARACGVERDTRFDFPSGLYRLSHIPVSVCESGDVLARAYVRWLEIQRSVTYIREQITALPEPPIMAPGGTAFQAVSNHGQDARATASGALAPDALVVSLLEGWRGEVCHVALTNSAGRFAHYKVVDPSFHNWMGLAMSLRGQQISDFPLCNKSFNLSYCGHDL